MGKMIRKYKHPKLRKMGMIADLTLQALSPKYISGNYNIGNEIKPKNKPDKGSKLNLDSWNKD